MLTMLAAPPTTADAHQPPPADVQFMQGMIAHHGQAVQMTALASRRSRHPQLRLLAERISVSQVDEIAIMTRWLEERKQPIAAGDSDAHAGHLMPGTQMTGMLTGAQLDSLRNATGSTFDRYFLRFMIQHHEGALEMVATLLASPSAARDPMLFQFASDVDTDQRAEIRRMRALLSTINK